MPRDVRNSMSENMTRSGENGLNSKTNAWLAAPVAMSYGNLPKFGNQVKVGNKIQFGNKFTNWCNVRSI